MSERRHEERPVEVQPAQPSTLPVWALLAGGPVLWAAHFLAVYLVAEASCAALDRPAMRFLGEDGLTLFVLIATGVAGAGCALVGAAAWRTRRDRSGEDERGTLALAGFLLAVGSLVSVVAVGLPVVVVGPC